MKINSETIKPAVVKGLIIYLISTVCFYILGRMNLIKYNLELQNGFSDAHDSFLSLFLIVVTVAAAVYLVLSFMEDDSAKIFAAAGGAVVTLVVSTVYNTANAIIIKSEYYESEYPRLSLPLKQFRRWKLSTYFSTKCNGDGLFKSYYKGGLVGSGNYFFYLILGIALGTAAYFIIKAIRGKNSA